MRIKFLKDAEYIQNNKEDTRYYKAGETHDVSDDHGQRWVRRQVAVEVPAPARAAKVEAPKADK